MPERDSVAEGDRRRRVATGGTRTPRREHGVSDAVTTKTPRCHSGGLYTLTGRGVEF